MDEASSSGDTVGHTPDAGAAGWAVSRVVPRASILIPVLNNERYVRAALRSVLAQWQPDLELLVLDDGSTDGSFEAVREVLAEHPEATATLVRNPRPMGIAALPLVLQQTQAPVLIQADSDDIALPGRIAETLACFEADPRCRLVTANAVLLSETGIPVGLHDRSTPSEITGEPDYRAALYGSSKWLGATSAYHRSLLEAFPPLDPTLCPYGLDLLLPFRATLLGTHHYLARPSIGWRQHASNSHKFAGAAGEDDAALERHGAFELMVLAQKLRDLSVLPRAEDVPAGSDAINGAYQQIFQDRFAQWCRVRNRLGVGFRPGGPPARTPDQAPPPVAIPPLATLRYGERRFFGDVEKFGAQIQAWDGLHGPELCWNWTDRTAVLAFRWAETDAGAITLGLCGGSLPPRNLHLSVSFGSYLVVEIGPDCSTVTLPISQPCPHDLITLLLHVPDAVRPAEIGDNPDQRCLGVQLLFIEAHRRDERAI